MSRDDREECPFCAGWYQSYPPHDPLVVVHSMPPCTAFLQLDTPAFVAAAEQPGQGCAA